MLLRSHVRRRVVIVKELKSLMERKPQRLPHLHGRQLTLCEALQNESLQKLARTRLVAPLVKLSGELLRDLDGDGHQNFLAQTLLERPRAFKGIALQLYAHRYAARILRQALTLLS